MHAVFFRFRSELRSRWRAWLILAVLVGAVAGTSLVLLAGSRRTGSAYDRFERAQRAYDLGAVVHCKGRAPSECRNGIGRLPAVESTTTLSSFPASIETLDGRSIQPDFGDACYSGPGDVETLFDSSGRFGTTINRSRFVTGRATRPEAADEVVISQETAKRLHLGPGDGLQVRLFAGADCMDGNAKWRAPQRVRIVGVQLRPGEVRPPSGLYFQWIDVTPAFVRRAGDVPDRADYLVVRLRPGVSPAALRAQAHAGRLRARDRRLASRERANGRARDPPERSVARDPRVADRACRIDRARSDSGAAGRCGVARRRDARRARDERSRSHRAGRGARERDRDGCGSVRRAAAVAVFGADADRPGPPGRALARRFARRLCCRCGRAPDPVLRRRRVDGDRSSPGATTRAPRPCEAGRARGVRRARGVLAAGGVGHTVRARARFGVHCRACGEQLRGRSRSRSWPSSAR